MGYLPSHCAWPDWYSSEPLPPWQLRSRSVELYSLSRPRWPDSTPGKAGAATSFFYSNWLRWSRSLGIRPPGHSHWSKRSRLWILWIPSGKRMVRAKAWLYIDGDCGNHSIWRVNRGSDTCPEPCVLGGAPLRANCRCFGGEKSAKVTLIRKGDSQT